jgi:adenosylcobyric acid synthase
VNFTRDKVNVAVVLLPRMSNFTDFNELAAEPDVGLRYAASPLDLTGADVVVLPGSKSTVADLDYLRQAGFTPLIAAHVAAGAELVGICGGYQMLGREIADPLGVEAGGHRQGFGFLDVVTELTSKKITKQVEAIPLHFEMQLNEKNLVHGYEIHMGLTQRGRVASCFRIVRGHGSIDKDAPGYDDGAISEGQRVWGTYIHGVFDNPGFRRSWLNRVRKRKGLAPLSEKTSENVSHRLSLAIDRWADHLAGHVNFEPIAAALRLPLST